MLGSGAARPESDAEAPEERTLLDPAAEESLVGNVLRGRFVLEEEIGRGGMGVVYRARDLRREEANDRKSAVAIKVLSKAVRERVDSLIALQREAKRAQLLAHPNIATVYDFDREDDLAYLCMELLTGRTLLEVLNESTGKGLPFGKALPIIRGMASGLSYAHQRGIVHADFKPGNVFVTDDGSVKVLDFGIARVIPRPEQTTSTQFDGVSLKALTPSYASCEMFEELEPDPRDDIYGLACVTYELLAGRHPFHRLSAPDARAQRLTVKAVRGLTSRQNRVLRSALAFDRERRTASVDVFLNELLPRRRRLARALALSALGALGLAAAITPWLLPREQTSPTGTVQSATPAAPEPAPEPVEPRPVDRATGEKIDRILEMADLHLAMDRLIEPAGSNAAEAYAAVDELQPGNRLARAGLTAVANRLETLARDAISEGRRSDALRLVTRGLEWTPGHPGLLALQKQLTR